MTVEKLLKRLAELPGRPTDTPTAPPTELVAFVVRWNRGLRQWKAATLADFAGVSVSTVERVERGERVSVEALDHIAKAFGYEAGYFTVPRIRLPSEEAAATVVDRFSNLEVVPVVPVKTHQAIREAASCHAYLIHRPNVPDAYDADIETLQEWLDLGSFILSDFVDHGRSSEGRRELYKEILNSVTELERRGLKVLSGVMPAPQDAMPDWKVAVISITPKLTDPGAVKRRHLLVDRRVVALATMTTSSYDRAQTRTLGRQGPVWPEKPPV
jgi:transcriptional regulator with XRE-family HTH domain